MKYLLTHFKTNFNERKLNVNKTSWTSSERLMYVQIYVQGYKFIAQISWIRHVILTNSRLSATDLLKLHQIWFVKIKKLNIYCNKNIFSLLTFLRLIGDWVNFSIARVYLNDLN